MIINQNPYQSNLYPQQFQGPGVNLQQDSQPLKNRFVPNIYSSVDNIPKNVNYQPSNPTLQRMNSLIPNMPQPNPSVYQTVGKNLVYNNPVIYLPEGPINGNQVLQDMNAQNYAKYPSQPTMNLKGSFSGPEPNQGYYHSPSGSKVPSYRTSVQSVSTQGIMEHLYAKGGEFDDHSNKFYPPNGQLYLPLKENQRYGRADASMIGSNNTTQLRTGDTSPHNDQDRGYSIDRFLDDSHDNSPNHGIIQVKRRAKKTKKVVASEELDEDEILDQFDGEMASNKKPKKPLVKAKTMQDLDEIGDDTPKRRILKRGNSKVMKKDVTKLYQKITRRRVAAVAWAMVYPKILYKIVKNNALKRLEENNKMIDQKIAVGYDVIKSTFYSNY